MDSSAIMYDKHANNRKDGIAYLISFPTSFYQSLLKEWPEPQYSRDTASVLFPLHYFIEALSMLHWQKISHLLYSL